MSNISYITDDLTYWPALRRLEQSFLDKVHQFYMVSNGNNVLLWTKEGTVYHLTGHWSSKVWHPPIEVADLSRLAIAAIAHTDSELLVLSTSNDLFTCQLADPFCRASLLAVGVAKVKTGRGHAVWLDTHSCIWTYGSNGRGQLGNGCFEPSDEPVHLGYCSVVDFMCTPYGTMVLSHSYTQNCNHLYYWGQVGRLPREASLRLIEQPTLPLYSIVPLRNGVMALDGDGRSHIITFADFKQYIYEEAGKYQGLISDQHDGVLLVARHNAQLFFSYTGLDRNRSHHSSVPDTMALFGSFGTPGITLVSALARKRCTSCTFNNPLEANVMMIRDNYRFIYANTNTVRTKSVYYRRVMDNHQKCIEDCIFSNSHLLFLYMRYLHTGETAGLINYSWSACFFLLHLEDRKLFGLIADYLTGFLCEQPDRARLALLRVYLKRHRCYCYCDRSVKPRKPPRNRIEVSLKATVIRYFVESIDCLS